MKEGDSYSSIGIMFQFCRIRSVLEMDGEKVHLMPLDCTLKANMKVTTDTREMQRITREYNKKSHADKLGN